MQRIITQSVHESQGERVDVIRTAPEEAWSVFLREFTRWCASEEVHNPACVPVIPENKNRAAPSKTYQFKVE